MELSSNKKSIKELRLVVQRDHGEHRDRHFQIVFVNCCCCRRLRWRCCGLWLEIPRAMLSNLRENSALEVNSESWLHGNFYVVFLLQPVDQDNLFDDFAKFFDGSPLRFNWPKNRQHQSRPRVFRPVEVSRKLSCLTSRLIFWRIQNGNGHTAKSK